MLLSGKHYNRCWNVDEIINDALERHFIRQYLQEYKQLINNLQCLKGIDGTKENILNNDAITLLIEKGKLRKTAQYWLIYMEMLSKLHQFQFAINNNNLLMQITAWEVFLLLCFATNKVHYAQCGTFYIQQLKNLDLTYPGAFEEICEMVSVRRNKTGIGQAIDLAGEQTTWEMQKQQVFFSKFVKFIFICLSQLKYLRYLGISRDQFFSFVYKG